MDLSRKDQRALSLPHLSRLIRDRSLKASLQAIDDLRLFMQVNRKYHIFRYSRIQISPCFFIKRTFRLFSSRHIIVSPFFPQAIRHFLPYPPETGQFMAGFLSVMAIIIPPVLL